MSFSVPVATILVGSFMLCTSHSQINFNLRWQSLVDRVTKCALMSITQNYRIVSILFMLLTGVAR